MFSLKALGASILTMGLVVAAVAPAQAATLSATATSTGSISNSGTNAYPISITFTPVTSGADDIVLLFPTGWTPVNSSTTCANSTVNSPQGSINCISMGTTGIDLNRGGTTFSTTAPIVFEFGANTLNVSSSRIFTINAYAMTVSMVNPVDTGTATLAAGSPSYAIGYNSNGGTGGSMSATTSSGSLTLPANGFVKSGSTFSGWRVGNASSGTIYQPGDTVTITQAVLVYAQ